MLVACGGSTKDQGGPADADGSVVQPVDGWSNDGGAEAAVDARGPTGDGPSADGPSADGANAEGGLRDSQTDGPISADGGGQQTAISSAPRSGGLDSVGSVPLDGGVVNTRGVRIAVTEDGFEWGGASCSDAGAKVICITGSLMP